MHISAGIFSDGNEKNEGVFITSFLFLRKWFIRKQYSTAKNAKNAQY